MAPPLSPEESMHSPHDNARQDTDFASAVSPPLTTGRSPRFTTSGQPLPQRLNKHTGHGVESTSVASTPAAYATETEGSTTSGTFAVSLAGLPSVHPALQRKGSKVSVACQACKLKKTKCSGSAPCESCVRNGVSETCEINEGLDSRRKTTRKREVEEKIRLESLIDHVRALLGSGRDGEISRLCGIAENGTREDFDAYLESQDPEIQQRLSHSVMSNLRSTSIELAARESKRTRSENKAPRRTAAGVAWLCQDPYIKVPAAPWVTDTDDQQFVSHLGDAKNPNCSPFLVNCIMAEACSSWIKTRGHRSHLFKDLVSSPPCMPLTSDPRACIHTLTATTSCAQRGIDRNGRLWAAQMYQMARDLNLANAQQLTENATAWAVYSFQGYSWQQYPSNNESSVPAHSDCLRYELNKLAGISTEINTALFTRTNKEGGIGTVENARSLLDKVQSWKKNWSACLKDPEGTVPHVLILFMHYHYILSSICIIFAKRRVSADDSDNSTKLNLMDRARTEALQIAHLAASLERNWPSVPVHNFLAHIAYVTAIVLLHTGLDDSESVIAFENLCGLIKAFSKWGELGLGMQLQIGCVEVPRVSSTRIPPRVRQFVDDMRQHAELKCRERTISFNSGYPSFAAALNREDPAHAALDRLFEQR
ncbi:hypothetical protein FH972_025923 [Carpinus fangiana]|uniref:Zn(2)-C6 fungal-type domain-containing protein n=1 Tax=Carpinus fangiana TaxID=176857 RepID=A0A5N6L3F3_9ROSI|nr:hypothetical protein FH972_025923 [Carpinus fangiana]